MADGPTSLDKGVDSEIIKILLKSRDIQTFQTYLENVADCIVLSALTGQMTFLRPVAKGYHLIIAPVVGDDGIL